MAPDQRDISIHGGKRTLGHHRQINRRRQNIKQVNYICSPPLMGAEGTVR
jgi:hypothetical protein